MSDIDRRKKTTLAQFTPGGNSRPVVGAQGEGKFQTEQWSGGFVFILAAGGAAIGFNNIWQFPYLVGQYGGGAFIIIYILFALLMGLPLLMSQLMLGRRAHASPVGTFRLLAKNTAGSGAWNVVGWLSVIGAFLIFSYLSVIAGWTLAYSFRAVLGAFKGLTADGIGSLFTALVTDPEKQLFWHAAFVVATVTVVARGVRAGLEPVLKLAVPLLLVLLLLLMVYAATLDAFDDAVAYLFEPDFTKLSATGVLSAMAQVFFSLSLGIGVMLMYGAHLGEESSIPRLSLAVIGVDTATALVAAVVVFAVLFSGGVAPASGPTLIFQALPLALDHLPWGPALTAVFFLCLALIAWTTAIALVEPVIVCLGEVWRLSRARSAAICGLAGWVLGIATMLSFGHWAFSFKFIELEKKLGLFDLFQILTSQFLLPITGIAIAVFAGWVLRPALTRQWLAMRSPCAYDMWLWLTRLIVPGVLLILVFAIHRLYA